MATNKSKAGKTNLVSMAKKIVRFKKPRAMDSLSPDHLEELIQLRSALYSGELNGPYGEPSLRSLYTMVCETIDFKHSFTVFRDWMRACEKA